MYLITLNNYIYAHINDHNRKRYSLYVVQFGSTKPIFFQPYTLSLNVLVRQMTHKMGDLNFTYSYICHLYIMVVLLH